MNKKIIGIFIMTLFVGANAISALSNDFLNLEDSLLTSKSSNVEWTKTYGEDKFEMLQCVQQTKDNGYIACGLKQVYDTEQKVYRPWVIKTDSSGNLEWEWILIEIELDGSYYNYFEDCYCMFVHQTYDGEFIAGFTLYCTNMESFFWVGGIVKLNKQGTEVWVKDINDELTWFMSPASVIELVDGSFLIVGHSAGPSDDNSEFRACLLKIDSDGNEQWRQEYDFGGWDAAWALCKTNDNGYLITGWADNVNRSNDFWMIKTDSNGIKLWEKTYGGSQADMGHARNCYQTLDGGYIMSGYTYSFGEGKTDAWIVKTDSIGNMIWNKTYGSIWTDCCWSFESLDDGSYVFCITLNIAGSLETKDDIHLVKTDSLGHIIWIQEYGGEGRQVGQHICKTYDGGFIVAGRNGKYFNDDSDGILVKFESFSNNRPNKPEIDGPSNGDPYTEYNFNAIAKDPDGDQIVSYRWDWGDGNFSEWLDTNEATYSWDSEDRFDIRVMVKDVNGGESDWSDPFVFITPKNKISTSLDIFEFLIQRFPFMIKILNQTI